MDESQASTQYSEHESCDFYSPLSSPTNTTRFQQKKTQSLIVGKKSQEIQLKNTLEGQYQLQLDIVLQNVLKLKDKEGWVLTDKNEKKKLYSYKIDGKNENEIINKGHCILKASVEDVKSLIYNLTEKDKGKWLNKYQYKSSIIQQFQDIEVQYIITKPPIISNLYSCVLEGHYFKNNQYLSVSKSIPLPQDSGIKPQNLKETKLLYCVWFIEKIDDEYTKAEYVSAVELNAPQFLQNIVKDRRGMEIIKGMYGYIKDLRKKQDILS